MISPFYGWVVDGHSQPGYLGLYENDAQCQGTLPNWFYIASELIGNNQPWTRIAP